MNKTENTIKSNNKIKKSKIKILFFGVFAFLILLTGSLFIFGDFFSTTSNNKPKNNNYQKIEDKSLFDYRKIANIGSNKLNSVEEDYYIEIIGVTPQTLISPYDGFEIKFPETITDGGVDYPVRRIDCTIDSSGNTLTIGGYRRSSFEGTTYETTPCSIEVPKCVEYITVGSFANIYEITEITLPFVGTERGNLASGSIGSAGQDGYYSAFLSVFGTGKKINGSSANSNCFIQNSSYKPSYYDNTNTLNQNPLLTDKGTGTVQWYNNETAGSIVTTELYLPYYLRKVTITDETVIANHAFFKCTIIEEINVTFQSDKLCGNYTDGSTIGDYAFANCMNLNTVTLPSNASKLGIGTFDQCWNLGNHAKNADAFVKLPDELQVIPEACFNECTYLEEITFPSLVETIGKQAFMGCKSLGVIKIPNTEEKDSGFIQFPETLKYIEEQAFRNCEAFTNVVVPNNVISIEKMAFNGCSNISDITLPFIGREKGTDNEAGALFGYIFGEYNDLEVKPGTTSGTTVQTNSGDPDETVDAYIHNYYIPLGLKNVTILNETVVSSGAFMNCSMIESLSIESQASIGEYDNIMTIQQGALYGCINLENLVLPFVGSKDTSSGGQLGFIFGTRNSISSYMTAVAIYNDGKTYENNKGYWYIPTSLKNVKLQHQTFLNAGAFYKTTMVENVIISKATQSAGKGVFNDCVSLKTLEVPFVGQHRGEENNWWYWSYDRDSRNSLMWLFAYMGKSVSGHYENAWVTDWYKTNIWDSSIPESFEEVTITDDTYIDSYAFKGFKSLKTIIIKSDEQKLSYIEGSCLAGCSNLETLDVPFIGCNYNGNRYDGTKYTIGYFFGTGSYTNSYAVKQSGSYFYIPKTLTRIHVSGAINYVANWAFANITTLKSVQIDGGINTIGDYCFYNDYELEQLQWPNAGFTKVANYAFMNCESLGEMYNFIPSYVTQIGNYALAGTSISYINNPGQLTYIGAYAFSDCHQITSLDLAQLAAVGNNSIGAGVFANCTRLSSVKNVRLLSPYMFQNCIKLEGINLDEYFNNYNTTADTIPEGLFDGCSSLLSQNVAGGLTLSSTGTNIKTIGAYAFRGCSQLTSFYLPESVEVINSGAFQNCKKLEKMTIVRSCNTMVAGTNVNTKEDYLTLGIYYGCNEDFYLEVYYPENEWPTGWGYNWNCYYPVYIIGDTTTSMFTYEYSSDVKGFMITGFNTDDYDFYQYYTADYQYYLLEGTLVFPSTYNGLPVVGICEDAFAHYGIDTGVDYLAKVDKFILGENFVELGDGVLSFDRTVYIYHQITYAKASSYTKATTNDFQPSSIGGKNYEGVYTKYRGLSVGNEQNYASRAMVFYKDAWQFVGTEPVTKMDAIKFVLDSDSYQYALGKSIEPNIVEVKTLDNIVVVTSDLVNQNGENIVKNLFYSYNSLSGYEDFDIANVTGVKISFNKNIEVGQASIVFTSIVTDLYGSKTQYFTITPYILELFNTSEKISINDWNKYNHQEYYSSIYQGYYSAKQDNNSTEKATYQDAITSVRYATYMKNGSYLGWYNDTWTQGQEVLNLPDGYRLTGTLVTTSSNVGDYVSAKQSLSSWNKNCGSFKWVGKYYVYDSINGYDVTKNFELLITLYVEITPYEIDPLVDFVWDGDKDDSGTYHYKYTGEAIVPSARIQDDSLGFLDQYGINYNLVVSITPDATDHYDQATDPCEIYGCGGSLHTAVVSSISSNFTLVGGSNPFILFDIVKGEISINLTVNYTLKDDDTNYHFTEGFAQDIHNSNVQLEVTGVGNYSNLTGQLITLNEATYTSYDYMFEGIYDAEYKGAVSLPDGVYGSFYWDSSNPLKITSTRRKEIIDGASVYLDETKYYNVTLTARCNIKYAELSYALTVTENELDYDSDGNLLRDSYGNPLYKEGTFDLDDSLLIVNRNFSDSTIKNFTSDKGQALLITYGVDGYTHQLGVRFNNKFLNGSKADVVFTFDTGSGPTSNSYYEFKDIPTPNPTVEMTLLLSKQNYKSVSHTIKLTLTLGNFNFGGSLDKEYDRKQVNGYDALLRRPADLEDCTVTFSYYVYTNDEYLSSAPYKINNYYVIITATGSKYFNDYNSVSQYPSKGHKLFAITQRSILIQVIDETAPYDSKMYDGTSWEFKAMNTHLGVNGTDLNLLDTDYLTGRFVSRSDAVGIYYATDENGNQTKDFYSVGQWSVVSPTYGDETENYKIVFVGTYEIKPREFVYDISVDYDWSGTYLQDGVYTFDYSISKYHTATVRVSEPTANYKISYSLSNPYDGAVILSDWSAYPHYFHEPNTGTEVYTIYVKIEANTYRTVYDWVYIWINGVDIEIKADQTKFTYDGFAHSLNISTVPTYATLQYFYLDGTTNYEDDEIPWTSVCPSFTDVGEYQIRIKATAPNYNTTIQTITMWINDDGDAFDVDIFGCEVTYDRQMHGITVFESTLTHGLSFEDLVFEVALKDGSANPKYYTPNFVETSPGIFTADLYSSAGEYPLLINVYSRGYTPKKLGTTTADTVKVIIKPLEFELEVDYFSGIYDGKWHTPILKLASGSSDTLDIIGLDDFYSTGSAITYNYTKEINHVLETFTLKVEYGTLVGGSIVYSKNIAKYKDVCNMPVYIKVSYDNFEEYINNGYIIITKGDVAFNYSDPTDIQYLARRLEYSDLGVDTCHDGSITVRYKEYKSGGGLTGYINPPMNLGEYRVYIEYTETSNCNAAKIEFDVNIIPRELEVTYDHELEYNGNPQVPNPTITTGTVDTVTYVVTMYDNVNPTNVPDIPTIPNEYTSPYEEYYYFILTPAYPNENYVLKAEDAILKYKIVNRKLYVIFDGEQNYTSDYITLKAHYDSTTKDDTTTVGFDAYNSNILSSDSIDVEIKTKYDMQGTYYLNSTYCWSDIYNKYILKSSSTPSGSLSFTLENLNVYNTSDLTRSKYYDIVFDVKLEVTAPPLEVEYDEEVIIVFDGTRHFVKPTITSLGVTTEKIEYWLDEVDYEDAEEISTENYGFRDIGEYYLNFKITTDEFKPYIGRIKVTIIQVNLSCEIDDFTDIYDGVSHKTDFTIVNSTAEGNPDIKSNLTSLEMPELFYIKKSVLDSGRITLADINKFFQNKCPIKSKVYSYYVDRLSSMTDAGDYYAILYNEGEETDNIGFVYVIKLITIKRRTLWFTYSGSSIVIRHEDYNYDKKVLPFTSSPLWSCIYDPSSVNNDTLDAGLLSGHMIQDGNDPLNTDYTFRTVSADCKIDLVDFSKVIAYENEGDFEFDNFYIIDSSGKNYMDNYQPAFYQKDGQNPFQIYIERIDLNLFDVTDRVYEYDGELILPTIETASDGDYEVFYYKADAWGNIIDTTRYYNQTDVGYYIVYVHQKMGTNFYEWKYPTDPQANDFFDSSLTNLAYRFAFVEVYKKEISIDWGETTITYDAESHRLYPTVTDVYGNTIAISYYIKNIIYDKIDGEVDMTDAGTYYLYASFTATGFNPDNYTVVNPAVPFVINKRKYTINYETKEVYLKDYWTKTFTEEDLEPEEFIEGYTLNLKVKTNLDAAGVYKYSSQFVIDEGESYVKNLDTGNNLYKTNIPNKLKEDGSIEYIVFYLDNYDITLNLYVVLESKRINVQTTNYAAEFDNQYHYPSSNIKVLNNFDYTIKYCGVELEYKDGDYVLPSGFDPNTEAYDVVEPKYINVGYYRVYFQVYVSGDDGVESTTGILYTDIIIEKATARLTIGNIDKVYDGQSVKKVSVTGAFNGDYLTNGGTADKYEGLIFEFKPKGKDYADYVSYYPTDVGDYVVRITSQYDNNSLYVQNYTTLDSIINEFEFSITPATIEFNVVLGYQVTSEVNIQYNPSKTITTIINNGSYTHPTAEYSYVLSGLCSNDQFNYSIFSNDYLSRQTYLYYDTIAMSENEYYIHESEIFSIKWSTIHDNDGSLSDNSKNYKLKIKFEMCVHFPYIKVVDGSPVTTKYVKDTNQSFHTLSNINDWVKDPSSGYTIKYSKVKSEVYENYNLTDRTEMNPGTYNIYYLVEASNYEIYYGTAIFIIEHEERTITIKDGAMDKTYDAGYYDENSWAILASSSVTTQTSANDAIELLPYTGWSISYFTAQNNATSGEWEKSSYELSAVVSAGEYIFRLVIPETDYFAETIIEKHFTIYQRTYTITVADSSNVDKVVEVVYTGSNWLYNLVEDLANSPSVFKVTGLLSVDPNGNPIDHYISDAYLVSSNYYTGTYRYNYGASDMGKLYISDELNYAIKDNSGALVRTNYTVNLDFTLKIIKADLQLVGDDGLEAGVYAYTEDVAANGVKPTVSTLPLGFIVEYSKDGKTWQTAPFNYNNCGTYTLYTRSINNTGYNDAYRTFIFKIDRVSNNLIIKDLTKVYDGNSVIPWFSTYDFPGGNLEAAIAKRFDVEIMYYSTTGDGDPWGTATSIAPKNVGWYVCTVTFKDTVNYTGVQGYIYFEIKKCEVDVNIDTNNFIYNAKVQAPDISFTRSVSSITGSNNLNFILGNDYTLTYYKHDDLATPISKPKDVGTYKILIEFTGSGETSTNHNYCFAGDVNYYYITYKIDVREITIYTGALNYLHTGSPLTINLTDIEVLNKPDGVNLENYLNTIFTDKGTYETKIGEQTIIYDSTEYYNDFLTMFEWSDSPSTSPKLTYDGSNEDLDNYKIKFDITITVAGDTIPYQAKFKEYDYDGQYHTFEFKIGKLSDDMQVEYSLNGTDWSTDINSTATCDVTSSNVHVYVRVKSSAYNLVDGTPQWTYLGTDPSAADYDQFSYKIKKAKLHVEIQDTNLSKVYDDEVTKDPSIVITNKTTSYPLSEADILAMGGSINYRYYVRDTTDTSGNTYTEVLVINNRKNVDKYYVVVEITGCKNFEDYVYITNDISDPRYEDSAPRVDFEIFARDIIISADDLSKTYDRSVWSGFFSNDPSKTGVVSGCKISGYEGDPNSGLVSGHYFSGTIKTQSANAGTYQNQSDFVWESSYMIYRSDSSSIELRNYNIVLNLYVLITKAHFYTDEDNYIIKFYDGTGLYDGTTEYTISHTWLQYPLIEIPDSLTAAEVLKKYDALISYNTIGFNVDPSDWVTEPIKRKVGTTLVYIKVAAPNYETYYTTAKIIVVPIPSDVKITDKGILANDKVYDTLPYDISSVKVETTAVGDTRTPIFEYYTRTASNQCGTLLSSAPIDVGNYMLKIKFDAQDGYAECSMEIPFNVVPCVTEVIWGANVFKEISTNNYKFQMYYTGSEVKPIAKAYGLVKVSTSPLQYELIPLEISVDRSAVQVDTDYKAEAKIVENNINKYYLNYQLSNSTLKFDIIKSISPDPTQTPDNPVYPDPSNYPGLPNPNGNDDDASPNNPKDPSHPNSPDNPDNNTTFTGISFRVKQYNPLSGITDDPFVYGDQIILEVIYHYSDKADVIYLYYMEKPTSNTLNGDGRVEWIIQRVALLTSPTVDILTYPGLSTAGSLVNFHFEFPEELTTPQFEVVAVLNDKLSYAWNTDGDIDNQSIMVQMEPNTTTKIRIEVPSVTTTLTYDGTPLTLDQTNIYQQVKVFADVNGTPSIDSDDVEIDPKYYTIYYGNNINPTSTTNKAYIIVKNNDGYVYDFEFGNYTLYKNKVDSYTSDSQWINKNPDSNLQDSSPYTFEIVSPELQYIYLTDTHTIEFVSYKQDFDSVDKTLVYKYGEGALDRHTALTALVSSLTTNEEKMEAKRYSMYKLSHIPERRNLTYIISQIGNAKDKIAVYDEDGKCLWDGAGLDSSAKWLTLPTALDPSDKEENQDLCIGTGTYIVLYDKADSTRKAIDAVEIVIVGDVNGDGAIDVNDSTAIQEEAYKGYDSTNPSTYYSKATYVAGLLYTNTSLPSCEQNVNDSVEIQQHVYNDSYDYIFTTFYSKVIT